MAGSRLNLTDAGGGKWTLSIDSAGELLIDPGWTGAAPYVPKDVPGGVGFTPADIIDMANAGAERRGKNLDLKKHLLIVTQELCQERRWHWRKKSLAFETQPGEPSYDLTAVTPTDGNMAGLTCERVCGGWSRNRWHGPKLILDSNSYSDLTPIFDTATQECARENLEQGAPGSYFMDGQDQFRLSVIPGSVYKVRVPMWVLPDLSPMEDTVRLVPAYLHHLLVKKLEATIFRFTLGEGSAKYQAAIGEYNAGLQRASLNVQFGEGRVVSWASEEEATQST